MKFKLKNEMGGSVKAARSAIAWQRSVLNGGAHARRTAGFTEY